MVIPVVVAGFTTASNYAWKRMICCVKATVLNNSLQRVLTSPVVDYICKNSFKVNSARLPRETGHSSAFVLLCLSHCSNQDHCSFSVQVFTFQRLFTAPMKKKKKKKRKEKKKKKSPRNLMTIIKSDFKMSQQQGVRGMVYMNVL